MKERRKLAKEGAGLEVHLLVRLLLSKKTGEYGDRTRGLPLTGPSGWPPCGKPEPKIIRLPHGHLSGRSQAALTAASLRVTGSLRWQNEAGEYGDRPSKRLAFRGEYGDRTRGLPLNVTVVGPGGEHSLGPARARGLDTRLGRSSDLSGSHSQSHRARRLRW